MERFLVAQLIQAISWVWAGRRTCYLWLRIPVVRLGLYVAPIMLTAPWFDAEPISSPRFLLPLDDCLKLVVAHTLGAVLKAATRATIPKKDDESDHYQLARTASQQYAILVSVLAVIFLWNDSLGTVGVRDPPVWFVAVAIPLGVAKALTFGQFFPLLTRALAARPGRPFRRRRASAPTLAEQRAPRHPAAYVGLVGLGAPLFEELYFRGLFYGTLRRSLGAPAATAVNMLDCAATHRFRQLESSLAAALMYGLLYERSGGNVWPGAVAHVIGNVFGITAIGPWFVRRLHMETLAIWIAARLKMARARLEQRYYPGSPARAHNS